MRLGLIAVAVLLGGCGGGDPCAGSPCPNDTKRTQAQYEQCRQQHDSARNDRCNPQVVAIELCAQANTVCGSDGKADANQSQSRINANCKGATDALVCCLLSSSACR